MNIYHSLVTVYSILLTEGNLIYCSKSSAVINGVWCGYNNGYTGTELKITHTGDKSMHYSCPLICLSLGSKMTKTRRNNCHTKRASVLFT